MLKQCMLLIMLLIILVKLNHHKILWAYVLKENNEDYGNRILMLDGIQDPEI